MPEYLKGIIGFIAAVAVTSLLFLGYRHYQLVNALQAVMTNQCSAVEKQVIDQAVEKALGEYKTKEVPKDGN